MGWAAARAAPTTQAVGAGGPPAGDLAVPQTPWVPARLGHWRRASAVWAVLVFAASSWPNPPGPPDVLSGIPALDKITHLLLYGVQGFLLYRAVRWPGRPGFSLARVAAVVGSLAVLGTVDEIHQVWIPGRGMEGADLLADVAGGSLGAALAGLFPRGVRAGSSEPTADG